MSSQKLITSLRYQKKELLARVIPLFEKILTRDVIILFKGHVGAGKTFLIKKLMDYYFGLKNINSPTYSYVKKYPELSKNDFGVVHFDLYRLNDFVDFCELGFWDELFVLDQIILIEWPEILERHLLNIVSEKKIYLVEISSISDKSIVFRDFKIFEFFF